MKRIIKTFACLAIVFSSLFTMSSCTNPEVDVTYTLYCSSDLLEYATPQVTHKHNGESTNVVITESNWEDAKDFFVDTSIKIGDVAISKEKLKEWTITYHYENFGAIDDEMEVKYVPKQNQPIQSIAITSFVHTLTATIDLTDKDGGRSVFPASYNPITTINVGITSEELEKHISEIKDYVGVHVEENGTVKKK